MGKGKSTVKRAPRIIVATAGALIILFVLSFIPTLYLKSCGMKELKGRYITVYYETEEMAAQDVFMLADEHSKRIAETLGFTSPHDVGMYIYDRQAVFQTKKYGWIALLLRLNWYVGDNRGTDVLLASPINTRTGHSYEEIKQAAIHEMVHAYNSIINQRMPLWLNEGLALYLTEQKPPDDLYSTSYFLPSYAQTHTASPIEFSNMGGYYFAYTYIEFLDKAYGWESVLTLAKSSDYQNTLGLDETDIYERWVAFLEENYN